MWSFSFAQQYTNYTVKDGLPSNHVYKITQDANGFIWILTDKGIVKYNGNEFKTFTTRQGLATNDVWGANVTPDGKIWYLSKSSKLGYIENDSVYAFSSVEKNEIFNPLYTSQVGNEIFLSSSTKTHQLVNNKWGVIYDGKYGEITPKTILKHSKISHFKTNINLDSILIFNKKKQLLKSFYTKDFQYKSIKRGQLTDSLFYWVSEAGYQILNLNTLKLIERTYKNEIDITTSKHARINILNNQLQISGTGFVGILDTNYSISKTIYFPSELNAHFAIIDNKNTVWIATFTNGVYKIPNSNRNVSFSFTNEKVGAISNVGNQLIANVFGKGFYKFNTSTKKFNPFINEKSFLYSATQIKELKQQFYISKNEIKHYNNNKLITNSNTFEDEKPRQLVYFNKNLYGFFTFGIKKINPIDLTIKKEYQQPGCTNLLVFNKELLIATSNGLKQLKNETIEEFKFDKKPFNKPILNLKKVSDKLLLVNTDGFGSYLTDLNTITLLPKSEFLIVQDAFIQRNEIWLATNMGVLYYKKVDGIYGLVKSYNESDGLPSKNINSLSIYKDKLIVSSNNGIAILQKNTKAASLFLDIYIDKATYNNYPITKNNNFEFTENNNVSFTVSTINFSENKGLLYNYKLGPIQNNWIKTNSSTFNFSDLQPNNYTLTIEANGIEKQLEFKIIPLWYQTTVSKIAITFLVFSIFGILIYFVRTKELEKKMQEFNKEKQLSEFELHALRSQMNPHFVFNSLNAIQYYITKNDVELSEKYLVKFSRLIRKFFDFSRDKFISLEQEISLLKNYLEIEKMRFGDHFNFQFFIDENLNLAEQKIPSMLLQPIVENAVNHGLFHNEGKGLIKIHFLKNCKNFLVVQISDNGVGLKKAQEIKENSIKTHISKSNDLLKNRINLLNQSKEWFITYSINELENGTGTFVELTFKHHEN